MKYLIAVLMVLTASIASAQAPTQTCEQRLESVQAYANLIGNHRNQLEGELAQALAQIKALQAQVEVLSKQGATPKK